MTPPPDADAVQGPPYAVFTYHKTGTVLFENVMARVARRFGLRSGTRYGMVRGLDRRSDIFILAHGLLGFEWPAGRRAVRVVRDPRDVWVSSYLYHRRCPEGWCVNTDFDPAPPVGYPRVDFSIAHYSEDRKQAYLCWLGGRSYQQNLLDRDQADGLAFELDGYTAATMDAMRAWPSPPGVMDVRLEEIAADFDRTMRRVFTHLGFDAARMDAAVDAAAAEDIARMDDATLAARPHIAGRRLSKWRDVLTAAQVAEFERRHGDVVTGLGYYLAGETDHPTAA